MTHRVVLGIQARTSSTRLRGKVLADVAGEPLIMRVVERARAALLVDEVVVLTSDEPSDDELAELVASRGVPLRRGSLSDVLSRYVALAEELEPALLVRVTGDCPLIEPSFIDLQLGALAGLDADLVQVWGNARGAFEGTLGGQSAMTARALALAARSTDPRDREHVGSFAFREHADELRFAEIEVQDGYAFPGLRLAVDEARDLELVRRVFEHFDGAPFTTLEALDWLRSRPEVRALNAAVTESSDNRACRELSRDRTVACVGRWP